MRSLLVIASLLALPACSDVGVAKYDTPPRADIASPLDGYVTRVGAAVSLQGQVHDDQTAVEDLSVLWLSGVDPQPEAAEVASDGTTTAVWTPAAAGTVSIVLSVDAGGVGATDEIAIEVIDDEVPTVTWTAPDEGATVLVETTLAATVADADDGVDGLTLAWTANGDAIAGCPAAPEADGTATCAATLPEGQVTLCLAATDAWGATGTACRDVTATPCQDVDGDGYTDCEDCDETDVSINPAATEVCDGVDDDCDGVTDEDDAADASTWYADADGDGFGDAASTHDACVVPEGYTADATDCDDTVASTYPGATEVCDEVDDDCDGDVDEGVTTTFYADADADAYGDAASTTEACAAPAGYVADDTDCDDTVATTNPGAAEVCDEVDDDCDGAVDEGVTTTFWADADADGYGDAGSPVEACSTPLGYVADDTDCDDTVATTNPGASEVCNEVDDDCDALVDEGVTTPFYADADGDAYGDPAARVDACTAPSGYVLDDTDCDDTHAEVNPDGTEVCSGLDEDCDGVVDFDYDVPEDYGTLTTALVAAPAGSTICVAPGTYTERLTITTDVIVEGWAGPESTILDGGAGGIPLTLSSVSSAMEFRGFTVRDGLVSSGAGGIYLQYADPWLDDLVVEDNVCTSSSTGTCLGTAIGAIGSDPLLTDVVVRGNTTVAYLAYGGALAFNGGSPTLEGVTVVDNAVSATYEMSLVFVYGSADVTATNLVVAGNDLATGDASALARGTIVTLGGTLTLTNATITGNSTTTGTGSYTGTISSSSSSDVITLDNVALTDNVFSGTGGAKAGGIYKASGGGTYDIAYCDVYGNTTNQYSGIASQTGTNGNISASPLYTDVTAAAADDWDLTPAAGSPLIDAGDPSITDVDGTTSDIGATGGPGGS